MPISQHQREQLRQAVVGYLAARSSFKFDSPSIRKSIVMRNITKFSFDEEDIDQELLFLEVLGFAQKSQTNMSETLYWQATCEGVRESDKNGWSV